MARRFRLLAKEAMRGKTFGQVLLDGNLRSEVRIGHKIGATLFAHDELLPPLLQHDRSTTSRFLGSVKIVEDRIHTLHLLPLATSRSSRQQVSRTLSRKRRDHSHPCPSSMIICRSASIHFG